MICDIWITACLRVIAKALILATDADGLALAVAEDPGWFATRSDLSAIIEVVIYSGIIDMQ